MDNSLSAPAIRQMFLDFFTEKVGQGRVVVAMAGYWADCMVFIIRDGGHKPRTVGVRMPILFTLLRQTVGVTDLFQD